MDVAYPAKLHESWQYPEREKQIEQVIHNTGGMYGDLQGLLGGSMPAIQALELPLLEEAVEEPSRLASS